MTSYKETTLILPKKKAPLDVKDLILRQVNKEDDSIVEYPKPISPTIVDALKPSVRTWNFIRQFKP